MDDGFTMDKSADCSARELAQRLLNNNIELENGLRQAAKSKIPSDPNVWLQMRENYEVILLEDHDFAEKHETEYALWQLHYRRIEEFRSHLNAAAASSHGSKNVVRQEHINKIRSIFKGFLSEATGYYHDLILKIRSKYGLPLSYMSESPVNQLFLEKDDKKSADLKNGILSCHRCLIYLGDLARYKGLYGDGGDSSARDYAAASSYYMQAASFWPSSGNPHHQLAILASYSGDELTTIYRYFRSLAVESPFLTARDNLIIAFEKNRQSYSQLAADANPSITKATPVRASGRGRGRGAAKKLIAKDTIRLEANPSREKVFDAKETYVAFCIRFVRLNGVLFTRTSLETFGDIFAWTINDFPRLLSANLDEDLIFGADATEKRLFFVRMISILIYTVHNADREAEGQSYTEILQRSLLLQNAFTAAFEIVGHVVECCLKFQDISSSYLLPAVLVFIEWLASCPNVTGGTDVMDDRQAAARSFFWTQCITLFNKLISSGCASVVRDDDETCFFNLTMYEEEETDNSGALWEDFELRGFLPLQPAHLILDFSRKNSADKERKTRVDRILAAGRNLVYAMQVDQQGSYFDRKLKKFCIGIEPESSKSDILVAESISMSESNCIRQQDTSLFEDTKSFKRVVERPRDLSLFEEEEDEEIVFKPAMIEKPTVLGSSNSSIVYKAAPESSVCFSNSHNWTAYGDTPISTSLANPLLPVTTDSYISNQKLTQYASNIPTSWAQKSPNGSLWISDQQLANGVKNLSFAGNGQVTSEPVLLQSHMSSVLSLPLSMPISDINTNMSSGSLTGVLDDLASVKVRPSMSSAVNLSNSLMMTKPVNNVVSTNLKRNSASRPIGRHIGPPPGFGHIPSRQINDNKSSLNSTYKQLSIAENHSCFDGYQNQAYHKVGPNQNFNHAGNLLPQVPVVSNLSDNGVNFPFPGKQVFDLQSTLPENYVSWTDNSFESQKLLKEQQQQLHLGVDLSVAGANQFKGHSLWSSQFYV